MADAPVARVRFVVNGRRTSLAVHPLSRLLDVLRRDLHLTGTKEGCGEGECGACSVLVNGQLVNSCLMPVLQVDGAAITTIEGVEQNDELHTVQQAFIRYGGAQCGICTPGMVLAAISLLDRHPNPTEEQVRSGLAGNLCRCTGYMRIFEAVLEASRHRASRRSSSGPPGPGAEA
jgi:carbon-monoxide dehydrogenase small subunit